MSTTASAIKQPENGQTRYEPASIADRIVSVLRRKPSAGRREIVAVLGATESTDGYYLDKLRAAGAIERVGLDRGGHWEVVRHPCLRSRQ